MTKERGKWNSDAGPDQDYWHKLNPAEKQWLYEFNQRYYKSARFDPKALTPEQYEKAGQGAGRRNDERSRALDNHLAKNRFAEPSSGASESTKKRPGQPILEENLVRGFQSPHSERFDFPKRRGRPTDERTANRNKYNGEED